MRSPMGMNPMMMMNPMMGMMWRPRLGYENLKRRMLAYCWNCWRAQIHAKSWKYPKANRYQPTALSCNVLQAFVALQRPQHFLYNGCPSCCTVGQVEHSRTFPQALSRMNPMGTAFTASEAPVESWKLQDVKPRIVLTVPQPIKQENSRTGSAPNTDQQTITAEAQWSATRRATVSRKEETTGSIFPLPVIVNQVDCRQILRKNWRRASQLQTAGFV